MLLQLQAAGYYKCDSQGISVHSSLVSAGMNSLRLRVRLDLCHMQRTEGASGQCKLLVKT